MSKLLYLFLLLSLFSCKSNSPTEIYLEKRDNIVNVHHKIMEIPMEETPMSGFVNIYTIDKYLIVIDYKSDDGLIYIFDKNTFQLVRNITSKGQGPTEIANIGDICPDEKNRKFYAIDHGKLQFVSYDLDSVVNNPSYVFQTKANFNGKLYPEQCCYINDSLSIVGLLEVKGNWDEVNQLAGLWNITTGEIKIGYEHPSIKRKRFRFAASEEQGIYVKCYSHYDLITICNLDGSLKCNIYGPNWDEDITETCHYNMDVRTCGDKIFALYSGADYRSREYYPSQIMIFDTDGKYIKTLETGYHLQHFCYDKDNDRIILYTDDEIQFGYLDLKGII